MTTDLEKQFFDTFGIEPYDRYYNCKANLEGECKAEKSCCACEHSEDVYCYPQITDRILLELICILTRWHLGKREPYEIMSINIEQLKNQILSNSLYIAKFYKAKKQVRELFKEN